MSLQVDGFKAFCDGIHPVTDPVARSIAHALTAIAGKTGFEQLLEIAWALHLCHVTGEVLWQYSGIDWSVLDQVQENGVIAYFGDADVDKILRDKYPPFNVNLEKLQKVCQLFGEDEWETNDERPKAQSNPHEQEGT